MIDLFNKPAEGAEALPPSQDTVSLAQQVMDENTTQLDPQEQRDKPDEEESEREGDGEKKKKRGLFSRIMRR